MALISYKQLLSMTKEKLQEALTPLRAREMRKKAELEQVRLDAKIVEKEQRVQELAAKYPIDFDALLDTIDDLDLLKRRQSQYEVIIKELFPDD